VAGKEQFQGRLVDLKRSIFQFTGARDAVLPNPQWVYLPTLRGSGCRARDQVLDPARFVSPYGELDPVAGFDLAH